MRLIDGRENGRVGTRHSHYTRFYANGILGSLSRRCPVSCDHLNCWAYCCWLAHCFWNEMKFIFVLRLSTTWLWHTSWKSGRVPGRERNQREETHCQPTPSDFEDKMNSWIEVWDFILFKTAFLSEGSNLEEPFQWRWSAMILVLSVKVGSQHVGRYLDLEGLEVRC